jgi:hypothetical protein
MMIHIAYVSFFDGATAMKSILDPTFKYYPAVDTDLRRTFRRIRQEWRRASSARSEGRQPAAPRKIASVALPRLRELAD